MRKQAPSSPQQGKVRSRIAHFFAIAIGLVVVLGAGTWLMGAAARSRLADQHPAPGRLVDMGGYKMHISCAGEGHPTVVLDAGLLDFSTQWARVMPAVAGFARVCAYDRAGLGWSEVSPHPRTSAAMVEELRALLSGADLDPPYVLVGHSFGGMNARLYAHRYPEEVAGVVLVDAAHEEQSLRIEALREAAGQTARQFRTLARLSALGFLVLSPERIPDRGLPDEAAAQYRAVLAATDYFRAASSELEALEASFAEVRSASITSLDPMPLIALSRGRSEPLPGLSEAEQARLGPVELDAGRAGCALACRSAGRRRAEWSRHPSPTAAACRDSYTRDDGNGQPVSASSAFRATSQGGFLSR